MLFKFIKLNREVYDFLKSKVKNKSDFQFLVDRFTVQDVANGLGVNIKTLRKLMSEWEISAPRKKQKCNSTLSELIELKYEKK